MVLGSFYQKNATGEHVDTNLEGYNKKTSRTMRRTIVTFLLATSACVSMAFAPVMPASLRTRGLTTVSVVADVDNFSLSDGRKVNMYSDDIVA